MIAGRSGGWAVRLVAALLAAALAAVLGVSAAWADGPAPQNPCPPGLVPSPSATPPFCIQPWIWPDDRPYP